MPQYYSAYFGFERYATTNISNHPLSNDQCLVGIINDECIIKTYTPIEHF